MVTSFWISFVAWLLNIYAVLALSSSPEAGLAEENQFFSCKIRANKLL